MRDSRLIKLVTMLSAVTLCNQECPSQVQIVHPTKLQALRQSLPATENDVWQDVFHDPTTLLYTEVEMPRAYQHADAGLLVGGSRIGTNRQTTFHWALNNISGDAREAAKGDGRGGNGNVEFPWRTPGGNDFSELGTDSFKLMWLPKRDDGRPWPIAFYSDTLSGSRMGRHSGYAWVFPVGTVFGEVLVQRDSAGMLHTYEMRIRRRESNYWDVDILRPFPTAKDLANRLATIDSDRYASTINQLTSVVHLKSNSMTDPNHPTSRGFVAVAASDPLPPLGEHLAVHLLDSTPFRSALGAVWRESPDGAKAFAPTTDESFSIVPRNYLGTFLGTDTDSCAKCHESTSRHVDEFDARRDWYGYVRGSDRIFTFHPIDPRSVSPNGAPRQVNLRQEFIDGGIVERFDPAKHPSNLYSLLK